MAVSSTYTQVPTITTTPASNISWSSLTSGGTITNTGGAAVTASGVCWNITGSPTIGDSKTTDNVASGAFTSTLGGLSAGLAYYIRAYATNSIGTAYGNTLTVTAGIYNTATFSYTGSLQTWTVPSGVTSVIVECWGAQGGGNPTGLGLGGYARGSLAVTPGQTLYVYVGQQPTYDPAWHAYHTGGWNGGGQGYWDGQSGGGASDVRVNGSGLPNRVIVAGGGGGIFGLNFGNYDQAAGGAGGGSTGGNGISFWDGKFDPGTCGGGGGQTYGGAKESGITNLATAGSLGLGGNGGNSGGCFGGAGGGGYYGGGGGDYGSGGGGSGYIGGVTGGSMTTATREGHGQIIISY
ncbi:MAG: glycine-rich protein [Betaproteobacteria bacterium]